MAELNYKTNLLRPRELLFFIVTAFPPLLVIFLPEYASIYIGRDSWLIFLFLGLLDFLFALIIAWPAGRETFNFAIWKRKNTVGKVFGILLAVLFAYKSIMFFRQSIEFVYTSIYTLEPLYYFAVPMLALMIAVQFFDVKNTVRLANIIFGLMCMTYVILIAASAKSFDINRLKPVLEDGAENVIRGIPHFFTWTGNSVILIYLLPKSIRNKASERNIALGVGISSFAVTVLTVLFMGVFGDISGFVTSSVLALPAFLDAEVFFGNFDSAVKLIWCFSLFLRDSVFTIAATDVFCESFGIKKKTAVKILMPVLIVVLALCLFENEEIYFYDGMGILSVISGIIQYCIIAAVFLLAVCGRKRRDETL